MCVSVNLEMQAGVLPGGYSGASAGIIRQRCRAVNGW